MTEPSQQSLSLPTPREMIAHLDRRVFGQGRAKQDLAVAVYNHYLSQAYRERNGVDLGRHHILLLGPTGVGKTYLVRTLAEFLGVPVGFSSAAGLVEAGFKGNSVESLVKSLLDRAGGDARMAEKGIVFLDEVDKIRCGETGGLRDISGEGVQNALLTLLDGRLSEGFESNPHDAVDTSRLLFVCAGAFVGLDGIVQRRLAVKSSRIGFQLRQDEEVIVSSNRPVYERLCQAQTRDLVEFGLIPEFIGRFATITVLHELGEKALRSILEKSIERSPLERQKELARIHGIELEIADEALDAIAAEASELGTGARGLHRLIGKSVDSVDHRWPELADDGVTKVVITPACIEKGVEADLLREERPAVARIDALLRSECLSGLPPRPEGGSDSKAFDHSGSSRSGDGFSFTDPRGMSPEDLRRLIDRIKVQDLGWPKEDVPLDKAENWQKWWIMFERLNQKSLPLVLRLCEELQKRGAGIQRFFAAYCHSHTDNLLANLHFMDYMTVKEKSERKKDGAKGDE